LTGGPCLCRCLIPLRSLARRLAALRFCPRSGKRRGLQQRCFISGLYHAASELAVYASQSASRRPTQDSLAAGGQPFAARDWLPAGHHRSFNHSLHGILFSRLGLAQFPWKPQPDAREGPASEGRGSGRRAALLRPSVTYGDVRPMRRPGAAECLPPPSARSAQREHRFGGGRRAQRDGWGHQNPFFTANQSAPSNTAAMANVRIAPGTK